MKQNTNVARRSDGLLLLPGINFRRTQQQYRYSEGCTDEATRRRGRYPHMDGGEGRGNEGRDEANKQQGRQRKSYSRR